MLSCSRTLARIEFYTLPVEILYLYLEAHYYYRVHLLPVHQEHLGSRYYQISIF